MVVKINVHAAYGAVPKGLLTFVGFLCIAEYSPWKRLLEFNINSGSHKQLSTGVFVTVSGNMDFCLPIALWETKMTKWLCFYISIDWLSLMEERNSETFDSFRLGRRDLKFVFCRWITQKSRAWNRPLFQKSYQNCYLSYLDKYTFDVFSGPLSVVSQTALCACVR